MQSFILFAPPLVVYVDYQGDAKEKNEGQSNTLKQGRIFVQKVGSAELIVVAKIYRKECERGRKNQETP